MLKYKISRKLEYFEPSCSVLTERRTDKQADGLTNIMNLVVSFWLQIQRSRVRSPALPDFLSSSGSGTGSTQPREVKLRSSLNKKVAAPGSENRD